MLRSTQFVSVLGFLLLSLLCGFAETAQAEIFTRKEHEFGWQLPWQADVTGEIIQTWHSIKNRNRSFHAIDIGVPAGTPILAPIDSTVKYFCIAKGTKSHHAIILQASDGQYYNLIHVSTSGLRKGKSFRQGEKIGVVASDLPNDKKCAFSYGIHLHLGLPSKNFSIGGYQLTPLTPRGTTLKSNNRWIR